jgi:hypothetical protein
MSMDRLKEPSTWAGLGAVVSAIGPLVADYQNPMAWAGVLAGLVAIFRREGTAK